MKSYLKSFLADSRFQSLRYFFTFSIFCFSSSWSFSSARVLNYERAIQIIYDDSFDSYTTKQKELCRILRNFYSVDFRPSERDKTLLHIAIERQDLKLFYFLLLNNANPSIRCHEWKCDPINKIGLYLDLVSEDSIQYEKLTRMKEILQYVIKYNSGTLFQGFSSKKPIHVAIEREDLFLVHFLLNGGADPESVFSPYGVTCLRLVNSRLLCTAKKTESYLRLSNIKRLILLAIKQRRRHRTK